MKAINLYGVVLLYLFSLFFVSCSKDDNDPMPEPAVPVYETTFNVTLGYSYKVTDTNSDQVLVDVDYGVADVNTFIYVIHTKSDGQYLKMGRISPSDLKDITADNITSVLDSLPEGTYYITFVAFKDFQIASGSADVRTFLEPLTKDYEEAVMQIPNDFVHYATTEFEVTPPNGDNSPVFLALKKMTTDLIFEFTDADKVPNSNDYRLTVGLENIPSAFFIASGKTLTALQTNDEGLYLYSGNRDIVVPAIDGTNAVVTTFHTLSNDNLPAADRGKYWFELKENSDGGKQIKAASVDLDEFSPDYSSSMYIYGLYDEKQPVMKTIKKLKSGL
jgi:hypothetical protein